VSHAYGHVVEAGSNVVLVGDETSAVLEGSGMAALLPLLDGTRTASEIVEALDRVRAELVHFSLLRLEKDGIVEPVQDAHGGPDPAASSACTEVGAALGEMWDARGARSAVVTPMGPSGAMVLLTDDYLDPSVETEIRARAGAPVTLARVGVSDVWWGPTVGEGAACLRCLQRRLTMNLTARALQHASAREQDIRVWALPRPIPRASFEKVAELAASEGPVALLLQSTSGGAVIEHPTLPVATCPECGDPTRVPRGHHFEIASRSIVPGSGGGFRTCTPEETWARLSPLISPLTGIVRRVERVAGPSPELIHAYTASHAGTHHAASLEAVKADARDHSGGKGITELDARVSALCESLERFSALHEGIEPTRTSSLKDLEGAVHPNAVQCYSEAQFANRIAWNEVAGRSFQWVAEPYDDEVIAWVPMRSLSVGERRWLPASMIYHGYDRDDARFARADSNGLAAGNCLEEALLQGLLELIERDSVALWWYNRARVPGVDLDSVEDPRIHRLLSAYDDLDRTVWVLDLTTDLQVPCYAALSAREEGQEVVFGFGCHLDPEIALRRAVTELGQMLPAVIRTPSERRRQLLPDFRDAIQWWEDATVDDHAYLRPSDTLAVRHLSRHDELDALDIGAALRTLLGRLADHGMEVLAHDLTRADVELSVVKVVVPGLRHFWRRLGPGRLYDVPSTLDWEVESTDEDGLNPISMFT
jgi:ribosomal protein S12 methylthiotransferase accessory factor